MEGPDFDNMSFSTLASSEEEVEESERIPAPVLGETYGVSPEDITLMKELVYNVVEDATAAFAMHHGVQDSLCTAVEELRQHAPSVESRSYVHEELVALEDDSMDLFGVQDGEMHMHMITWSETHNGFYCENFWVQYGNCTTCLTAMPVGMECPHCQVSTQRYSKRLYFLGVRDWERYFQHSDVRQSMTVDDYLIASQGALNNYSPVGIATMMGKQRASIRKYDRCFFQVQQGDPPSALLPMSWQGPLDTVPMQGMSIERLVKKLFLVTPHNKELPVDIETKLLVTGADPIQIRRGLDAACLKCMNEAYRAIIMALRFNEEAINENQTLDRHFQNALSRHVHLNL